MTHPKLNPLKKTLALYALTFLAAHLTLQAQGNDSIQFNRDIRPILSDKCFFCHGPDAAERKGDLRLDTATGAFKDMGGYQAIVAGNASESELVARIVTHDEDDLMPPPNSGKSLTREEIERIQAQQAFPLPVDLDYGEIQGLSNEVVQKLSDVRPATLGQASRISGVTPAAVSLLLIHLKKHAKQPARQTA